MQALSDLLAERERDRLWQDYTASVVWSAARSQYKEYPLPSWTELTAKKAHQDNRTAEEIKEGILARLRSDE